MPNRKCKTQTERMFNEQVGRRICAVRKNLNISQTALAVAVGIGQPLMFRYEVGAVCCPTYRLVLIARRLGVRLDSLIPNWHKI